MACNNSILMLGYFQLFIFAIEKNVTGLTVRNLFVMGGTSQKSDIKKNYKNSLAPDPDNVIIFRKNTQEVWSKVAGRPISEEEADEIMENFGLFLKALTIERKDTYEQQSTTETN